MARWSWFFLALALSATSATGFSQTATGWQIPALAAERKNPLAVSAGTLARGKMLYAAHCQRCHGQYGQNDGADANRDEATADLTDPARISINPDGVVYYKVWYGRFRPDMPAFGEGASNGRQASPGTLTSDEVWSIVAYVQTLRRS